MGCCSFFILGIYMICSMVNDFGTMKVFWQLREENTLSFLIMIFYLIFYSTTIIPFLIDFHYNDENTSIKRRKYFIFSNDLLSIIFYSTTITPFIIDCHY